MGFILNQDGSSGFDWKVKKNAKKKKRSQTPGATKGENCMADAEARYMTKRSRSYKHKNYANWFKNKHNSTR